MGEALASHDFVGCRMDTAKLNPVWLRGHEQEKGVQAIWYPPWLPHVGGGTMGFRRSLFEELGGFDESMLFLQDTDFCFRAQNRGYVIHFVPDAVLHMRRRRGLLEHFHQSRNYAEYNSILARKYWGGNDSASGFHDQFKRDWIELIFSLKDLCHTGGRFHWVWRFGRQVGRMKALLLRGGIPV